MCLVIDKTTKEKVIKKDLIVYKVLQYTSLKSVYEGFRYNLKQLHKCNLKRSYFVIGKHLYADYPSCEKYHSRKNNLDCYTEGFHSYATIKRLKEGGQGGQYVRCIIPKGSIVVKDKTGLIVSNQIIIDDVININQDDE